MLQNLKKILNHTYTENGALTNATTMDECLDLFATAGGLRNAKEEEIVKRFVRAYAQNPDIAMKILFYTRDIRGGLGERRLFRVALRFLCNSHKESVIKNMKWIAEFGRYDDFLILMDTPCEKKAVSFLMEQLKKDIMFHYTKEQGISLLAKWLPSINTSNPEKVRLARKLAKAFGMSEKEYRKTLSMLRKEIDIIENHLREEDYSFDYENQSGNAMFKYRRAFYRNDKERYTEYLDKVSKNKAKMHTATLMPYEIIRPFYENYTFGVGVSDEEANAINVTWNAQEDFTGNQDALVVVDGSGSMYGGNPKPITVAQSLGLYFAERNKGAFANHFITFSMRPQLIQVKGKKLNEKLKYISTFNEMENTNIQAVFELILQTAVNNKLPQSQMPERLIFISDMEFDRCAMNSSINNFEYAKNIFNQAGYKLPKIVFWNVASRNQQFPVTQNEQGVTLVSGCNARLFEQVVTDHADPYQFMLEVIGTERYEEIVA